MQFLLGMPPPPALNIVYPSDGQSFTVSSSVHLSGSIISPGGLAAFCTRTNDATLPPPDHCTQLAAVSQYGYFFGVPVDQPALTLGSNTLYAFAYDRWGQTGIASVRFNLPTDLRVTGMEVTQGIQTMTIPLNTSSPQPYVGTKLVLGGKTVVRVFANALAGGPYAGITARLCGSTYDLHGGYEVPLGCIAPDNGPRSLSAGNLEVSFAERSDPNGAYVFTLPHSWTTNAEIKLRSVVDASNAVGECAGCMADNTFIVAGIRFVSVDDITISPVEVIWTNSKGVVVRPSPPAAVFARTGTSNYSGASGRVVGG